MGYFSNGTEGLQYEARWCVHCVHNGNCAVWDAHMAFNYEKINDPNNFLHRFIPVSPHHGNLKCKMFFRGMSEVGEKRKKSKTINPAQLEWAKQRGLV